MAKNKPQSGLTEGLFENFEPNSSEKNIQTTTSTEKVVTRTEKSVESFSIITEKKEARSQRVTLLVQPSVIAKVKNECEAAGISVNELVNQFLDTVAKKGL